MTLTLRESYRHCEHIARTQARNFYYGFMLLPPPRRQALSAMYAFFRTCDDYSDEDGSPEARRAALEGWRQRLDAVVADPASAAQLGPIFPAFSDAITRYKIPPRYFHELLEGTLLDQEKSTYATFDELYEYCYRVASTVGLVCVHIFGFDGSEHALRMAEWCGIAFQLTNIIRDVEEDARLGRVYLPQEDLNRFGISAEDLHCMLGPIDTHPPEVTARMREMLAFEADRAERYYTASAPLIDRITQESHAGFAAMVAIYHSLLRKIQARGYGVFGRRVKLSTAAKIRLLLSAYVRKGRLMPSGTTNGAATDLLDRAQMAAQEQLRNTS